MTRRERHIAILKNFGRAGEYSCRDAIRRMGYDAYSDECIEAQAAECVRDWRDTQKRNARNRAIYAAQVAEAQP